MAKIDEYLDLTGLTYYHNRIKNQFSTKDELTTAQQTLQAEIDEIVSEGGEPNKIDTVKVNGQALTPDSQKAVDITVPTKTSELENDGDGVSNFATEQYVAENGGKIDTIKVNNEALPISAKAVNIDLTAYAQKTEIPTKTSDLTNDSDFQTEPEVQALIDAALEDITGIDFQVVDTLPATGEHGVIYLVHKSGSTDDIYDEYIWVTPASGTAHYEKIGTTEMDLSEYWSKEELVAITTAEIDTIVGA